MNPNTGVIGLLLYTVFFLVMPRMRDVRMSGWWLLLTIIPLADIALGTILLFRAPVILDPGHRGGPSDGPEASPDDSAPAEADAEKGTLTLL